MQKLKKTARRAAPWLALFALLAGFALVRGLNGAFVNDYNIMNGDWQNYNPVRRLLAGQRPYEDFTVYLGAGELYSVAAVLLVVGNSFGRSMLATHFLTWLFFELLVLAGAVAVLRRGRPARLATAGLCTVFFAAVQGWPGASVLAGALSLAAAPGNSARMIRAGGLPLAILLIALGLWLWERLPKKPGAKGLGRVLPLSPRVLVPLAAGAFVPWSNDMGAALYLSVSLAYGLLLLRRYGKDVKAVAKAVLFYIGVSVCGLLGAVLLTSGGHPFAWLRQTRGAGAYQAWYYGSGPEEKLLHFWQLPVDAALVLVALLAVGCAVWLFLAKREEDALSAAGAFALSLAMVLWHVLYCLLSASKNGPIGGCALTAAVLLPFLALRLLTALWPRLRLPAPGRAVRRGARAAASAAFAALLAVGLFGQVQARRQGRGEGHTYVPSLGAWLGDQAEKLATEETVAAGRTVWSTYATALEAMTGQFQPSGTDYIIHVLGDAQRQNYLAAFAASGVELVQTPSWKVSSFERWSRNANWWFYRELYKSWAPVANTFVCGGMHLFWQRTGTDNDLAQPLTAVLSQGKNGATVLTVTAQDKTFCGVADVAVCYQSGGRFVRVSADTEKALCEAAGRDSFNCDFYLSGSGTAAYLPVTISDGVGRVTLEPVDGALTVQSAVCEASYFDWEYFYE